MRKVHIWTDEDQAMLFSCMTNQEIAEALNLSEKAVRSSRRYYTGHYTEQAKTRDYHTKITNEARVLQLAKELRVKIAK